MKSTDVSSLVSNSTSCAQVRFSPRLLSLSVACIGLALAGPLRAHGFRAPRDIGELARAADVVALFEVESLTAERRGGLIFTRARARVVESVSGPLAAGDALDVVVPGGVLDDLGWLAVGSPQFRVGTKYFGSLQLRADGGWVPILLAYGLFESATSDEGERVLRPVPEGCGCAPFLAEDVDGPGASVEPLRVYREAALIAHLRLVLSGESTWQPELAVASSDRLPILPESCSLFVGNGGLFLRWQDFDRGSFVRVRAHEDGDPSRPDALELIDSSVDWWNAVPSSRVRLVYNGVGSGSIDCTEGPNDLALGLFIFDDPCGDLADLDGCTGTLAIGGPFFVGSHEFEGAEWLTIVDWGILVNDDGGCVGSEGYTSLMAHELGHCLGLDHSSDNAALMRPLCCNEMHISDEECIRFPYPGIGQPVRDLSCTCSVEGGLVLEWSGGVGATGPVRVLADGVEVARLPSATRSWSASLDELPPGARSFCVINGSDEPVCCSPCTEAARLLAGDCDLDGSRTISDAVCLFRLLFSGEDLAAPCGAIDSPASVELLDHDGNRAINLSDGIAQLQYLVLGGEAPAAGLDCLAIDGCPDLCER